MISKKPFRCLVLFAELLTLLILLQGCSEDHPSSYSLGINILPDKSAGVVSVEPDAAVYPSGSEINLIAVPTPGWRFERWESKVSDCGVPVTTVTINQPTTVTAHFIKTSIGPRAAGEDSGVLNLDASGYIISDVLLAIPEGSELKAPKDTQLTREETGPLQGNPVLHLKDKHVSDIPPVNFTNWIWVFDVSVEDAGGDGVVIFSSHNDANVVDPDYVEEGFSHTSPLGASGINAYETVVLYLAEPAHGKNVDNPAWLPVAKTVVEQDGMANFSVFQTGLYAIGHRRYPNSDPPIARSEKLYDCTIEFDRIIDGLMVVENSNAEMFGAWSFFIPTAEMPETTKWFAQGGDEPSWGRLENHGRRFRVRSAYANAFDVSRVTLKPEAQEANLERSGMTGPYEVYSNGQVAENPVSKPYDQCDFKFATRVKIKVLARNGTRASFNTDFLTPLRAIYDNDPNQPSSNVSIIWFRKLYEGYYAELWVRTLECARKVANNIPLVQEEGVILPRFDGRTFFVLDLRGLGPYIAVHTLIEDGKALGLRFYDPFWPLDGGVLEKHVLGGVNNMFPVVQDMRYDPVTNTLWIFYFDFNHLPHVERYDRPTTNFGDRPCDVKIHLGDEEFLKNFIFNQLYLDPAKDRLFLVYKIAGEPGDRINVYANASSIPVLENQVAKMTSPYPYESQVYPLYLDYIAPVGDIIHMCNRVTKPDPDSDNDGFDLYTYDLSSQNDHCARFKAVAAFKSQKAAPIEKGIYSRVNENLYAGTNLDWNGFSAIYAIIDPSSWTSEYIKLTETSGYWIPDTIRYETLTWANIGKLLDMSIREGSSELMAVSHTPDGWEKNTSQILLFDRVNGVAGKLTPVYIRDFSRRVLSIALIDPPDPPPQQ